MGRRRTAGTGVWLAAVMALSLGMAPRAWAADAIAGAPQASILFTRGDVTVRVAGGEWQPAQTGQALPVGAEVRVGPQSYVELTYDQAHTKVSRLDQEGIVTIAEDSPEGVRIELQRGRLFNLVAPLASGEHFIVQTPEAVASVRGTAFEGTHTDHTEIKVFDLGDADPHAVAVQAVDREGRLVWEERLLREGEKSIADEGRVRDAQPLSADEQQQCQELLKEVEQHTQEAAPVEGAQQSPPGGPPPGSPPAGLANAPSPVDNTAAMPREMPGAPPMDEAHLRTMADTLGVPPEQFKEMSPKDIAERMEDRPMDAEHMRAMAETLGVSPERFREMSHEDIAQRMEGQAMERMRVEQELIQRGEAGARDGERLPEFSNERPGGFPERMMEMEHPAGERGMPDRERFEQERMERESSERWREDFRDYHEAERPDRHEMATEIRQEHRDFSTQPPPPSTSGEPMPPPSSGDQPPH